MYWGEFLTIVLAHFFAVASPGPDFAMVFRQSIRGGTKVGIWTSFGVSMGIFLHVSYCILGVALLLAQSTLFMSTMKYIAGCYLGFIGVQSIRNASPMMQDEIESADVVLDFRKAVVSGFLTNGLNPKATLFFLALFAVVLDEQTPMQVQIMYGVYLVVATFLWFALLSNVIGLPSIRSRLLKSAYWFERAMGLILIILALQLVLDFDLVTAALRL